MAKDLENLRGEAVSGRTEAVAGLSREDSTFHDYVVQLAYPGQPVPDEDKPVLAALIQRVVAHIRLTIDVLDFWKKPIEVK